MKQKQKQKNDFTLNGSRHGKKRSGRIRLLNKIIFGLVIICGVYFIMSINDLSVKGFILENLKTQRTALANENNNTELQIMDLESYDNLQARAANLKMVKVDKIDYIAETGAVMAKK